MQQCRLLSRHAREGVAVRLTMECSRNATGQFEGTIEVNAHAAVAFSGTLELLKVLQDLTQVTDSEDGRAVSRAVQP
jgi:hypothetical protein